MSFGRAITALVALAVPLVAGGALVAIVHPGVGIAALWGVLFGIVGFCAAYLTVVWHT